MPPINTSKSARSSTQNQPLNDTSPVAFPYVDPSVRIRTAAIAYCMVTKSVGNSFHRLDAPSERVAATIAPAADPAPAEVLQPAAAGAAVLRHEASASCAWVIAVMQVIGGIILWSVSERLAWLLLLDLLLAMLRVTSADGY